MKLSVKIYKRCLQTASAKFPRPSTGTSLGNFCRPDSLGCSPHQMHCQVHEYFKFIKQKVSMSVKTAKSVIKIAYTHLLPTVFH